ncbi:hypothetical protein [Chitinophaga pinensis]|uniref:RapA2 cadherin-like domain-containing protein n=1 Tax=Chitinophaga pinensis TaxID=79329 RepID=A0A5C6LID2_9BACT|nr:hypothetical protein [Chitinophaga pinensis]TWV91978.1 hypothetical protein FEF09_28530 [Chitinophaga pinensis]
MVNFNPAAHAVGVYTAVIRIVNNDTNTDRADFTFTVSITVNALPTVTNFTVNGTEDNTLAFTAANFTANYNDRMVHTDSIRITSLPLNGSFRLNGTVIVVGQIFRPHSWVISPLYLLLTGLVLQGLIGERTMVLPSRQVLPV